MMHKLRFLKRYSIRIGMGFLIVLPFVFNARGNFSLGFVERLEKYTYDLRLQWLAPRTLDKRIVILDIDEKSLKEEGHWPWPRNKLARLINLLFDQYKIDVLGFDVLFAERDESSGLRRLEELARSELRGDRGFNSALGRLMPELNYDQIFADSLKNRRIVLGYYFQHQDKQASSVGVLPAPVVARGSFDPETVGATAATGFAANLPELQASSTTGGFFNASPLVDSDGVFRRIPLLQNYRGDLYQSLALGVASLALREPTVELGYVAVGKSGITLESLKLGKRRIPVDSDVASLIPYRGNQGSFVYVSASDILQGKVQAETLRQAIVLLGSTAPGLMDLRSTPMQDVYPGVEVHANLIAGIIDGNIKELSGVRQDDPVGFELVLALTIGVLLAIVLPTLTPLWATALSIATLSLFAGVNLWLWTKVNVVFSFAPFLLMIAGLFAFNMAYGFFIESRGKRMLSSLFGQYVPPELVDEMAKDPGAYTLTGESREMTVLFSDVRGFTSISEELDPQQLTQLMNEFLTPMTQVIHRHRGTIDKYMGDAIMAFWGAPLSDQQHARHALLAAFDMIDSLDALQDQFRAKGWPVVRMGIGINTGVMTVGNMGSEFRLAYTVIGDSVNLGSRLEGLTKVYGVQIIVSEYTRAQVPDFVFRELDSVRVKGRDKAVKIYQPIGPASQINASTAEELASYSVALSLYREQNWQQAEEIFAKLRQHYPQRYLYEMYEKRIVSFREHPPDAAWDGSFVFTTK